MEFDNNNVPEQQDDNYVEIYSKRAILGFSIFPTPIFGGVLLMINLNAAGYKKAVYHVLIFSISYFFIANLLASEVLLACKINLSSYKIGQMLPTKELIIVGALTIFFNTVGGLILTQHFFKKYFPDNDYYPKSIATPVIVIALIVILMGIFRG